MRNHPDCRFTWDTRAPTTAHEPRLPQAKLMGPRRVHRPRSTQCDEAHDSASRARTHHAYSRPPWRPPPTSRGRWCRAPERQLESVADAVALGHGLAVIVSGHLRGRQQAGARHGGAHAAQKKPAHHALTFSSSAATPASAAPSPCRSKGCVGVAARRGPPSQLCGKVSGPFIPPLD